MHRKTGWLVLTAWLLGSGIATFAWAELPLTKKERYRKERMRLQIKCLQRCEKKGYRRFYRCGPDGNRYQKARAGVHFRACVNRCNAPWFCPGYARNAQKSCASTCLRNKQKTRPRPRSRSSKRQYRRWLKRYLRWRRRTRYACRKVCRNYNAICNIQTTVKLPPKTPIPKFSDLR